MKNGLKARLRNVLSGSLGMVWFAAIGSRHPFRAKKLGEGCESWARHRVRIPSLIERVDGRWMVAAGP